MSTRIRFAASLLAWACAAVANAQGVCVLADSELTCRQKVEQIVNAELTAGAEAAMKTAVAEGLAATNTGEARAASPDVASTFNDFFTTLKVAASQSSEDDSNEALGFELSRCMRERIEVSRLQCQARLRVGGAEIYEPLRQALSEARAAELENGLERSDSITFGVFLNLVGQRWGRVPRFGDEPLFDAIWTSVTEGTAASTAAANAATNAYEDVVDEIVDVIPTFGPETTFQSIAEADADLAARALALREAAYRAEYQSMDDLRRKLVAADYFKLVELVNNQPQLSFGAEYTQRDDVAGPEEWRAKLVWEKGFVNVNSARAYVQSRTGTAGDSAAVVGALNDYLNDPATARRLENGDRLALSIELIERKAYEIDLITDQVTLRRDAEDSIVAAFSYGYYLDFDDLGKPKSRLDIKAAYEDVSTDAARQDRGTLSVTFSQLVLGKTLLAVSLIYGTKPEYRGDVDEELSARLGFNYKWGKSGAL